MFLQSLMEAAAFTVFLIGMPLALGVLFELACLAARRTKGGKTRGHRH